MMPHEEAKVAESNKTADNATASNMTASNVTADNSTASNMTVANATAPNMTAPNVTQPSISSQKAVYPISGWYNPMIAGFHAFGNTKQSDSATGLLRAADSA